MLCLDLWPHGGKGWCGTALVARSALGVDMGIGVSYTDFGEEMNKCILEGWQEC